MLDRHVLPCLTAVAAVTATLLSMDAAGAVTIETVPVGNVGNAPDQDYGDGQFGAVGYSYRIGKYEVTNAQYCEFLNAKLPNISDPETSTVLPSDTYGLYSRNMETNARGGIEYNPAGVSGEKFSPKPGRDNNPVVFVCWYDTVRFANWLTNGQGGSTTEDGSYSIAGGGQNSGTVTVPDAATRATWAAGTTRYWLLPSEDEWYKAAYHQPAGDGGDTDDYWYYPTATNNEPYSDQSPGSDAPVQSNTANFRKDDGVANNYDDGFAVTGSTSWDSNQNYLTDAGAYTLSSSFYETFDQGGSVWEWNEADISGDGSSRGLRGGDWGYGSNYLRASTRISFSPSSKDDTIGFRVASIPEPGSITLLLCGALAGLMWRSRRRRPT